MENPKFPTADELKRAEMFAPGSAKIMVDGYIDRLSKYDKMQIEKVDEAHRGSRHARLYRYVALVSGFLLSVGSLSLCVYAMQMHANISQLAIVLTPVGVIAGVFLRAGRPAESGIATRSSRSGRLTKDHGDLVPGVSKS